MKIPAPYNRAGFSAGMFMVYLGIVSGVVSIALGLWHITRTNWPVIIAAAALAWAFSH